MWLNGKFEFPIISIFNFFNRALQIKFSCSNSNACDHRHYRVDHWVKHICLAERNDAEEYEHEQQQEQHKSHDSEPNQVFGRHSELLQGVVGDLDLQEHDRKLELPETELRVVVSVGAAEQSEQFIFVEVESQILWELSKFIKINIPTNKNIKIHWDQNNF